MRLLKNNFVPVVAVLLIPIISVMSVISMASSSMASSKSVPEEYGLGDYPSPVQMYAQIYALAAGHPELASIHEYGTSVQGRPLLAIHIARKDSIKRPEALVAGNIHGNEYIGNRLAMSVARRLLEDDGKDPWITSLLDRIDFWVIPCINPDGYAKTWEMAGNGPWPVMRKNGHGVDLNRNFPRYGITWIPIPWAGSKKPENVYYRGIGVYSEPESRAVAEFAKQRHFFASIDYHSWAGQFIPAKCPSHKCVAQYKKMSKAFKSKQEHHKYYRFQFRWIDQYTGEMEDMLYYEYGTLAVCIEISTAANNEPVFRDTGIKFWRNNPQNIDHWIENDRDASLAAIEKALELTGGRPEPPRRR